MSIKKIAEKAGVSISTVSRILNRPDYKCSVPGLREKVWSIAMEMNYVPNEAARNLKKGTQAKESKIWYINVLMTRTDESRTDPFFTELLKVRYMNITVFYQKSGICRFFLMIENAEEKILTRSFSECILRQKKIKTD